MAEGEEVHRAQVQVKPHWRRAVRRVGVGWPRVMSGGVREVECVDWGRGTYS